MKFLELKVVDRQFVEAELENGSHWDEFASCRENPRVFSPVFHESKNDRESRVKAAKAICRSCLVRQECLESALDNFDPTDKNIRGGFEASEIKRLHKNRPR